MEFLVTLQPLLDDQQSIHDNLMTGEDMAYAVRPSSMWLSHQRHALTMQFISSACRIAVARHKFRRAAADYERVPLSTEARDAIGIHGNTSELLYQNSNEILMESFRMAGPILRELL